MFDLNLNTESNRVSNKDFEDTMIEIIRAHAKDLEKETLNKKD